MVLGTAFVLFLLGGSLFANGVQESRVAKARELIAERNYDDALLILVQVVQEEPDRQDEAQDLISQVVRLRNQYNVSYEELINLLYVQKDEATALQVIAQLEALDKNPNKQTRANIAQAKRTASLVANNRRYRDIMARALAFLDQREYARAVQVYLEGQNLAKDLFVEEGYGNIVTDQVNRSWDDLRAASALFVTAEAQLKALPAQGAALLASEGASAPYDALLATMKDLATWRQRAWGDAKLFRSQNDFLVKNGRQEDFFLGYSYLFVHGPPDAKTPEGILGAIDRLWGEILDPWTARIRAATENRYVQVKAAADQGGWASDAASFEGLRIQARRGLDTLALWNRISAIDENGVPDPLLKAKLNQVIPLQVFFDQRLSLATQGIQASKDIPRALSLLADSAADRPTLEKSRSDVKAQAAAFATNAKAAATWNQRSNSLVAAGYAPLDASSFGTAWQTTWNGLRQRALVQEAEFVDRRGSLDFGLLDGRFQRLTSDLNDDRLLVEGAIKYPLQATTKLRELRPLQDAMATEVNAFIRLYDGESAEVKTPAVLRWPARGRDLLSRLAAAQTLQGQLLATATANYQASQTNKKQGQDLVPQVDTAITINSEDGFKRAETLLNQITARYTASLALQEDPVFRTASDAEILALGKKIADSRNKWLVAEVQKLVDQGSSDYGLGNFAKAKNVLSKAQALWATYFPNDPNPEVEYWLTLAGYATSVASGRELTPLDPLYNEVQQLLNSARRAFTLGQTKIEQGDRETGAEFMRQSKDTVGKILQLAPFNQKARVLNLEVLQASDPENFPVLFKQNFDTAVLKTTSNPKESLSDLEDLKSIQPDYPGLAAAIKNVNLVLFPPKKEVNNDTLRRVQDLVARANRLFAAGRANENDLNAALALVRQGQALDPTNRELSRLGNAIVSNLPPPALDAETLGAIAQIQAAQQRNDYAAATTLWTEIVRRKPGVDRHPTMIKLKARNDANT